MLVSLLVSVVHLDVPDPTRQSRAFVTHETRKEDHMRSILLLAPLIALAGCVAGGTATPADRATITYAPQPCFGACPVYTVTVSPAGQSSEERLVGKEGVSTGKSRCWACT